MIKYRTSINPTITQWENNDPILTEQLCIAYYSLLKDNSLDPKLYKPVLGWTYLNDDYAQNRITLIIEAVHINDYIEDTKNYKDILALRGLDKVFTIKTETT